MNALTSIDQLKSLKPTNCSVGPPAVGSIDRLSPARGVVIGVAVSFIFWIVAGAATVLLFLR